jgi:hypothetical protein
MNLELPAGDDDSRSWLVADVYLNRSMQGRLAGRYMSPYLQVAQHGEICDATRGAGEGGLVTS